MFDDEEGDILGTAEFLKATSGVPEVSEVFRAINTGDNAKLAQLLETSVSVEVQNSFGLTPLQVACFKKNHKAVEMLVKSDNVAIRSGCNVDAVGGCSGKTALSVAAFAGDVYIFETLINHKASILAVDAFGGSVLHDAVLGGSAAMVDHVLKAAPALASKANHAGRTPAHLAAFLGVTDDVEDALSKGRHSGAAALGADANGRTVEQLRKAHRKQNSESTDDGNV